MKISLRRPLNSQKFAKIGDFAGYGLIKLALFPSTISDCLETLQSISKYLILKFQFKKLCIFGYFCALRCQKLQNYENIDFFPKIKVFDRFVQIMKPSVKLFCFIGCILSLYNRIYVKIIFSNFFKEEKGAKMTKIIDFCLKMLYDVLFFIFILYGK